ncbi:MAG TPA: PEPxxWA-CTERM sorting domain-containing protein [Phenylobacterium sp.]|nr:PEPxxWA-CTERM sorting domain-containing protein [Phenylobacterium sp.]
MRIVFALAAVAALAAGGSASAAVVSYTSQAAFQAALDGSHTLVNFDTLGGFAAGYRLDDGGPAAALAALGVDSVGLNAQVAGGQDFQTPTARDRIILNGAAFGGHIAFDFASAVNGVGAFSNNIDYGRIRLFSGTGLSGTFLGEAQFTCDFNDDKACGVYDLQFGTFAAATTAVPEPATWTLAITGFGAAGARLRRRRRELSISGA